MPDEIELLMQIKEQLLVLNNHVDDVKRVLESDRSMMWKILALTIIGAFALIGVKLVLP